MATGNIRKTETNVTGTNNDSYKAVTMEQKPFKIFVVEDNEWYNRLLVYNLSLIPDYEVVSFFNGKDCLNRLNDAPDVVTLDYRLPDMSGLEVLSRIKNENPDIQVILISEQDDIQVVLELLKLGAYDYIIKTNDIKERLINTINNIRKHTGLKNEFSRLQKEVQIRYHFQSTIHGESPAIKRIFGLINKAITTDITVSITGETGTGKELVAKAIHYSSRRNNKPFVPVNVAAIPKELIESELFGHEKGSFTGATYRRIGKFEEAKEGTLFLDEIAEMDITLQAKILRVLQEKEIVRLGSNKPISTDCRIIVATNKNLKEEVKKGNFREDLYYRLFGLPIELPPLRERDNDVLILSKTFIENFCKNNDLPIKKISPEAQKILLGYAFPGNIRELKSIIELAVTLSDNEEIQASDLTISSETGPDISIGQLTLREYEMQIINAYLKKYNNNIKLVAEKLDVGVSTIYRMLKENTVS
jgi:two-component system response regulator AtoC